MSKHGDHITLKPCAKCGSLPGLVDKYALVCPKCFNGYYYRYATLERACKSWNDEQRKCLNKRRKKGKE